MSGEGNEKGSGCMKCIHFYITWDKNFPKGCRAMGFKCHEMPSKMVYQASGVECLRFEPKIGKGDRP
jgi:hypothetical protein